MLIQAFSMDCIPATSSFNGIFATYMLVGWLSRIRYKPFKDTDYG
jgi:hypothetical protein